MPGKTQFDRMAKENPEALKKIASRGGRSVHAKGKAHKFTVEEAKKGGAKTGEKMKEHPEHMAEIGKKGGKEVWRKKENSRA